MGQNPGRLGGALAIIVLLAACSGRSADGSATDSAPPASVSPPFAAASASASDASPSASASPAATEAPDDPTPTPVAFDDALLAIQLRDVRSGETFTLGELAADAPVIVETMAIWCTNCRQQMHEVTAAHDLADFHSVSIDVEPAEIAEDLVAYAGREGFDWPFVLADAELATALRDRFGTEVLFPPGMPKLLVRTDGSVELLPLGDLLSADEIAALVTG
jgi:thiol-disulfide isomerase/thioredoxin